MGAKGQVGSWQGRVPILLQGLSSLFGDKRQRQRHLIWVVEHAPTAFVPAKHEMQGGPFDVCTVKVAA